MHVIELQSWMCWFAGAPATQDMPTGSRSARQLFGERPRRARSRASGGVMIEAFSLVLLVVGMGGLLHALVAAFDE